MKVLFASGSEDLIPAAIDHLAALYPELPLEVVSEFPPGHARWFPFPVRRGFWENLARCRAHFRGRSIRIAAVILQPRMPYWRMRLVAFALSPWNFLAFNENFGHFMLRPRSAGTILRHLAWRARNLFVWEFSPGGAVYTLLWRLAHPRAFRRPWLALLARLAGCAAAVVKMALPAARVPPSPPSPAAPPGISVVIPSRNGKHLLAALLPEATRQIEAAGGEIIVVDNGSDDGTAAFLASAYPGVALEPSAAPLSFARAVNRGARRARFRHVCLLNNDMEIAAGFFDALSAAFGAVPGLFCATAQIFFPEGARREETGKAAMPFASDRNPPDFPVRCEPPVAGEDLSYVLYGSGGCSLFDAAKLRALGGLDEIYEPAYVEDLDLGFRAWQRGWPSVFVSGARVTHRHRATTSRYYAPGELERILELNYLRFVARAVLSPRAFLDLWGQAVRRLNLLAGRTESNPAALAALARAAAAPLWLKRRPRPALDDAEILALGSGRVAVFPGLPARGKPRALIVSPYLPFPLAHGGAVRMYNLMRAAAADFDQALVSFVETPGPVPAELLEICVEVVTVRRAGTHALPSTSRPDTVEEFDSPAFRAALRQTSRKWKPALAQLEFTQMAQYAGDCAPAKTVLVEHDVTLDLYRQLLAQNEDWDLRRQLEKWVRFETAAWRRVDRVIAMSEKDRALVGPRAVCLPNGVDTRRFRPGARQPERNRLLFIGSFGHLPNLLAIDFFVREVWPRLAPLRPSLHIIAGARRLYFLDHYRDRVRADLDLPGIEIEDFVSDVRPAYERAALVIAPLLASAGTNIKILEAMAMGKAIVSTPAGVNGLDLNFGVEVSVARTAAEMAASIAGLLEHPGRRQAFEQSARAAAERDFDWEVVARRQKALYRELMGIAPAGDSPPA